MRTRSKGLAVDPPSDPSPSTSRAQDVTHDLEPSANKFDDATHDRMDEEVLKKCPVFTADTAPFLLLSIVSCSDGRLDLKYKDLSEVENLLEKHPTLMELLREAWPEAKSSGQEREVDSGHDTFRCECVRHTLHVYIISLLP